VAPAASPRSLCAAGRSTFPFERALGRPPGPFYCIEAVADAAVPTPGSATGVVWKVQVPPAGTEMVALAVATPSGRPTAFSEKIDALGEVTVVPRPLVIVPV